MSSATEETEWGVRHEGGKVTIQSTGHGFASRMTAEREAAKLDYGCEYCTGTSHEAVCQKVTYWDWESPGPLPDGPLALPE